MGSNPAVSLLPADMEHQTSDHVVPVVVVSCLISIIFHAVFVLFDFHLLEFIPRFPKKLRNFLYHLIDAYSLIVSYCRTSFHFSQVGLKYLRSAVQNSSRIIFTNGLWDPWRSGGVSGAQGAQETMPFFRWLDGDG